MMRTRIRRTSGFTLIELLTVVIIIMIVAGFIMAAVWAAQESGRVAHCKSNLRQIHKLVLAYASTYGGFLPAFWHERWCGEMGLVGVKWGTMIDDRNPNVPPCWDNNSPTQHWLKNYINATSTPAPLGYSGPYAYQGEERQLIRTGAAFLVCRSDVTNYRSDQGNAVSYMGLAKYGWWHRGGDIFSAQYSYFVYVQLQEVNAPSRAIMLCETEPGTWQFGNCGCRWHAYSHPSEITRRHYGGGNILHFDGAVRLVKSEIDRQIETWEPGYQLQTPGWD